MTELNFRDNGDGNQVLINETFQDSKFADLVIVPPLGKTVLVQNTSFIRCTTSPGTCVIGSGVTLDRVTFDNFDCGDAIRIASEVAMREVCVIGRAPQSLIVQPGAEIGYVMQRCQEC